MRTHRQPHPAPHDSSGALSPRYVHFCARFLQDRIEIRPEAAIILGSGLDAVGASVRGGSITYREIPGYPLPTVEGHAGVLSYGQLGRVPVLVFRGRSHLYEGHHPTVLSLPVRIAHALGCRIVVVTNAAGGLRKEQRVGDLMLIRDHIGLPGLAGMHPLSGWRTDDDADRFVPMDEAYDAELRATTQRIAAERSIPLAEGIYAMVAGPTYETPAERRLLALLGADAVGMSTVPEVQVARHLRLRVLGFSCIANVVDDPSGDDHQSVVDVAARAAAQLEVLIRLTLEAASTAS